MGMVASVQQNNVAYDFVFMSLLIAEHFWVSVGVFTFYSFLKALSHYVARVSLELVM